MNVGPWLCRLSNQLIGWKVRYRSGSGYRAAPAPGGTTNADIRHLTNVIGPTRDPKELRTLALERYGWHDYCDTCGVLARECGHRRPETPDYHT